MVKFGKNLPCMMIDKGTIALNESTTYEDAYVVEGLKYNLLSVAQLMGKGYKFNFKKGSCKIVYKIDKLLATRGESRGNIF